MTTDPTPMVRRYQVRIEPNTDRFNVVDATTTLVVDTMPSYDQASATALSLNRVEMLANQYVTLIMQRLAEPDVCGQCGTRYAAPGMTACSSCGGAS